MEFISAGYELTKYPINRFKDITELEWKYLGNCWELL